MLVFTWNNFKEISKHLSIYKNYKGPPVFLFTEYKIWCRLPEKGKEYPWKVILVNNVDSKVHEFSNFHNKWKTDDWRDDKNVKIAANKRDDNALHF